MEPLYRSTTLCSGRGCGAWPQRFAPPPAYRWCRSSCRILLLYCTARLSALRGLVVVGGSFLPLPAFCPPRIGACASLRGSGYGHPLFHDSQPRGGNDTALPDSGLGLSDVFHLDLGVGATGERGRFFLHAVSYSFPGAAVLLFSFPGIAVSRSTGPGSTHPG